MFVIDASVLVADFRPSEAHHRSATELLDRCSDAGMDRYVPEIALAEVASGLARGSGDPSVALRATRLLRAQSGLRFAVIDAELSDRAARIASEHLVRGCDAIYLGLAERLALPLVTLDRQQRERSPGHLRVWTPAETMTVLDEGEE